MATERTFEPIAIETTKTFAYGECAKEGAAQPLGYNPLHRQLALDMIDLCAELLSVELSAKK